MHSAGGFWPICLVNGTSRQPLACVTGRNYLTGRNIRRLYFAKISPGIPSSRITPLLAWWGAISAFLQSRARQLCAPIETHTHTLSLSLSLSNFRQISGFSSFVYNQQCICRRVTRPRLVRIMDISESGVVPWNASTTSRKTGNVLPPTPMFRLRPCAARKAWAPCPSFNAPKSRMCLKFRSPPFAIFIISPRVACSVANRLRLARLARWRNHPSACPLSPNVVKSCLNRSIYLPKKLTRRDYSLRGERNLLPCIWMRGNFFQYHCLPMRPGHCLHDLRP